MTDKDVSAATEVQPPARAASTARSKKAEAVPEGYRTIEDWKAELDTPEPLYRGMCRYRDWGPGRMVDETEYRAALEEFGGAPMGRRRGT